MQQIGHDPTKSIAQTPAADEARQATQPARPIRFVAQVAPVKEVTLHGSAELHYWEGNLGPKGFTPIAVDGRAQLFLSATEARFMGILFRECIIGIHVRPANRPACEPAAMYLLHAWNSLRGFAWIERTFFQTPYYQGCIAVSPQHPAAFAVNVGSQTLITAKVGQRAADDRLEDENWQGEIFLPRVRSGPQQYFIARLGGATAHIEFDPAADSFNMQPSPACPTLSWLAESQFAPRTWHVRQAAAHAKSKTYRVDKPVA